MIVPDRALGPAARAARIAAPRFWRDVRQWQGFIASSEQWTPERLARYQVARLRALLMHSVTNVPYYRKLLASVDFEPAELRSAADLERLPLLDKRIVQERREELLANNVSASSRYYFATSGSSGTPVGFWHDVDQLPRERAFISTLWRRVGYREGTLSAVLRGDVIEHGLWKTDVRKAALLMSSYHLTPDRIPAYLSRLRSLQPRFLQAYPSSAAIVARFMLDEKQPPISSLNAVLCGSENLYPWQRTLIEKAFKCRVYSWYGQSECVALAGECEFHESLHLFPQYGYTELVADDGSTIKERGVAGEIVATGLHARAMPLIRYRTGDIAVFGADRCQHCRRPYQLLERIEGRQQEYIVTSSGRRISMTAINMHSRVFDNVFQFRFVQERPGELILRVVPTSRFSQEKDPPRIMEALLAKLGADVVLQLEIVAEVPRGGRGKYHVLDQMLEVEED